MAQPLGYHDAMLFTPTRVEAHFTEALMTSGAADLVVELGAVSLMSADHTVSTGLEGLGALQERPDLFSEGDMIELAVSFLTHDVGKGHPLVAPLIDSPNDMSNLWRVFVRRTHTRFGAFKIEHGLTDLPMFPGLKPRAMKISDEHHEYQGNVDDDVSLAMAVDLNDALQQNRDHRPGFLEDEAIEKASKILGDRLIYGEEAVYWLRQFAAHRRRLREKSPDVLHMVASVLEDVRAARGITLQAVRPDADLAVFSAFDQAA